MTKFSIYLSFAVRYNYTKIGSFPPILSIRIVLSCFYLLITHFETFSTWISRLPFAVLNAMLNLSFWVTQTSDSSWEFLKIENELEKNGLKQFFWIKLSWSYLYLCRSNEQKTTSEGKILLRWYKFTFAVCRRRDSKSLYSLLSPPQRFALGKKSNMKVILKDSWRVFLVNPRFLFPSPQPPYVAKGPKGPVLRRQICVQITRRIPTNNTTQTQ